MGFMYHDDDPIPREEGVGRILPTHDPRIPHDWVEKAAYFHWEKRGRPHGSSWADWLSAEKELRGKLPPSGGGAPSHDAPHDPPAPPDSHSWLA